MDVDVLILGGGTYGCAIAYELSRYSLNIALIEKEYDIATEVDTLNSSIVCNGFEAKTDLVSKFQIEGNKEIREACKKFNISIKDKNSLYIAYGEEEKGKLLEKYKVAKERGIEGLEILDAKAAMDIDRTINKEPDLAVLCKNTAIVSPYEFAIALGELAFENGVNFRLAEKVLDISKISNGYLITTTRGKFKCKVVINTIPEKNYDLDSGLTEESYVKNRRNLSHFAIDAVNYPDNIITYYEDGINTIVVPAGINVLAGVITEEESDVVTALDYLKHLMRGLRTHHINSYLTSSYSIDDIIIDHADERNTYIKISGKNCAELTMTPVIARLIKEKVLTMLNCIEKRDFIEKRRDSYKIRDLNDDDRNELIDIDPRFGKVVCVCNLVTEGEIVDSIRRPLGARTVEGVKRRTGAMLGFCKGSGCLNEVVSILARELDVRVNDIVKEGKDSMILNGRIKEFDEI